MKDNSQTDKRWSTGVADTCMIWYARPENVVSNPEEMRNALVSILSSAEICGSRKPDRIELTMLGISLVWQDESARKYGVFVDIAGGIHDFVVQ